jgi:hypothetical protein
MSNRNRDSIAIEESRIALLQTDSMWRDPGFAIVESFGGSRRIRAAGIARCRNNKTKSLREILFLRDFVL